MIGRDKLTGWCVVSTFMILSLFSLFLFFSLSEGESEKDMKDHSSRGWHGHRLDDEEKADNRRYIEENLL